MTLDAALHTWSLIIPKGVDIPTTLRPGRKMLLHPSQFVIPREFTPDWNAVELCLAGKGDRWP